MTVQTRRGKPWPTKIIPTLNIWLIPIGWPPTLSDANVVVVDCDVDGSLQPRPHPRVGGGARQFRERPRHRTGAPDEPGAVPGHVPAPRHRRRHFGHQLRQLPEPLRRPLVVALNTYGHGKRQGTQRRLARLDCRRQLCGVGSPRSGPGRDLHLQPRRVPAGQGGRAEGSLQPRRCRHLGRPQRRRMGRQRASRQPAGRPHPRRGPPGMVQRHGTARPTASGPPAKSASYWPTTASRPTRTSTPIDRAASVRRTAYSSCNWWLQPDQELRRLYG